MKPDTRSFYEQAVQRAIEHIARSLDEALDLETLASGACLSPFHFHRVFRGMVGETPIKFVPVSRFIPRDSGGQTMNVEIKEVPDLRVAAVRHFGP